MFGSESCGEGCAERSGKGGESEGPETGGVRLRHRMAEMAVCSW